MVVRSFRWRHGNPWRWVWIALLLALVLVSLTAVPVGARLDSPGLEVAQSVQQLQQQQQEINKKRAELENEQNRLQTEQATSENRLQGLQQNITATANQITETEYRLSQAEKQLKDLQAKLEQALAQFRSMQQATVARLQFLQRQQGSEGWAVLLQSNDFNEFLDRRYQLKRVYQADQNVLDELKRRTDDINQQKAGVEAQKNQVALLRQQQLAQKQQYEQEAASEQSMIARLKNERGALEAAEAQLARESEQLANLIREKVAAQTGIIRGTGRFIYPAGARLTSGFGTRVHPILGSRRFHSGVDFGASHGTTIRAADSGRVIFSGWYGGYGQAVVIDHGDGLSTLYAHASRLFVQEGQAVQQGQPIAAVGSTGLSTGPHLHFEVRRNGSPIDPMGFL
ncbi:M23 family metallopeptidase [Pseudanabaena sp. FACHB-2040]|uniref:murein hydrolase activator EnvC family protein n=1 Tax=Pseudanabaena sp. FACHB-2040 TaxID=2692859 RepID=UPI001685D5B2|nr:M23 family metallopeptidase [Pseudanabaena sp. FACHB-2040]MBD2260021.1 peptidoglycan DD-metalloendopeptidase family protein [Pseudanabaena sp. FACHB-2040]